MRPAARIDDFHVCFATTEGERHIGGRMLIGAGSVEIEKQRAVRAGDTAKCENATDVITQGSGTVKMCGMPAARLGEVTAHGGQIITGAATVMIGGPTVTPPGMDQIVKNVAKIDELRRQIEKRGERVAHLEEAIRQVEHPKKYTPGEEFFIRLLEKEVGRHEPRMPPGVAKWQERENLERGLQKMKQELEDLKEKDRFDEKEIQRLEQENRRHRTQPC